MDDSTSFSVDTVLAPVDGSAESVTAVEYAVAVADRYDASVHALFVLGHGVVRGMDAGTVEEAAVAEDTQAFSRMSLELPRMPTCHCRPRSTTAFRRRAKHCILATSSSIRPTTLTRTSSFYRASR